MTEQYVDTHAHLDEPAFAGDLDEVLLRAAHRGVTRVVNIGYRPARWETSAAIAARYPQIAIALGLHPQQATEFDTGTCDRLKIAIRQSGARAVGEIGLDYYRDYANPAAQRPAFAAQLDLAVELQLPVIIHQRLAETDCWDMLRATPPHLPVLLHCFEGSPLLTNLGRDRGYYFGIGGLLTRTAGQDLRAVVPSLPLDRIVLETDSPYLTPARVKVRRNEPANVPIIASLLASMLGQPLSVIARETTRNAERFFALPPSPIPPDPVPGSRG